MLDQTSCILKLYHLPLLTKGQSGANGINDFAVLWAVAVNYCFKSLLLLLQFLLDRSEFFNQKN